MAVSEISQIVALLSSIVGMLTVVILFLTLRQQKKEFNEGNSPVLYIGDKNFKIRFNDEVDGKMPHPYYWNDDEAINTEYNFKIFNIGNKPAINLEYSWDWGTNSSKYLNILKSLDVCNEFNVTWEKSEKFKLLHLEEVASNTIYSYAIDKNVPIRFAPFVVPLGSPGTIYLDEGIVLPRVLSLKARDKLKNPDFSDAITQDITQDDLKLPELNLKVFYEDIRGNKYYDVFRVYLNREFYPLQVRKINRQVFDVEGTFKVFKVSQCQIKKESNFFLIRWFKKLL